MNLRLISNEDINYVIEWNNDKAFCQANGWPLDRTENEMKLWWQRCVEMNNNHHFKRVAIIMNNGMIGYGDIAEINGESAELGIAIGNSSIWGQGVGSEALLHIMNYGFTHYGIINYFAETHTTNKRAQGLLKKLHFEEVSREGQEAYLGEVAGLIQYKRLVDWKN